MAANMAAETQDTSRPYTDTSTTNSLTMLTLVSKRRFLGSSYLFCLVFCNNNNNNINNTQTISNAP